MSVHWILPGSKNNNFLIEPVSKKGAWLSTFEVAGVWGGAIRPFTFKA